MVLAHLTGATASREELCRVVSVDTISPGLWITVRFLDGRTRSFRPDMIRAASEGERALETAGG